MERSRAVTLFVSVVAVALISICGVNAAYAYSGSVTVASNSIGAEWLSIDYCDGDGDPLTGENTLTFHVDGEAQVVESEKCVEYTPEDTLVLRVTGGKAQDINLIGGFRCATSNPALGAAIMSVKFVFQTDIDCELGGNHSAKTPTVLTNSLVETGVDTGVFACSYTIQKIVVYYLYDLQIDGFGKAYVSIDGDNGSKVPIADLQNLNNLDFIFSAESV